MRLFLKQHFIKLVVGGSLACFLFAIGCVPEEVTDQSANDPTVAAAPATDDPNAPLTKSNRFYRGTIIASDPSIHKTSSGFEMYYTDLDLSTTRTVIARAVSSDGKNWETRGLERGIKGLVLAGETGSWDENLESASVVDSDQGWLLFYSGYQDKGNPMKGFPAALGLATSSDGITFTRAGDAPVMQPTQGWYDNDAIYSPTILRENGVYHMIYVGHAYTDTSKIPMGGVYLLSAKSQDGRTWTKGETPIAGPGKFDGWRAEGVAEPYLVRRGAGDYLLFYTGLNGEERAIGVATGPSIEGPWDFGSKPLVTRGKDGAADAHQVLAPAVTLDGENLRLWYLAANTEGALTIGEAGGSVSEAVAASR